MNTTASTTTKTSASTATDTTAGITTVYVPAPDGTPLATDLCLPATPGPHPAIVIRTPYGRTAH
ncbi:peptidase S15, partial [Streptomyces sp. SID2119]